MNATVVLQNVECRYRSTRALDGVTLELGTGVTGLLGPNGAGKTTLMRLLATVLPPDRGEIRLLGRDPRGITERTAIRRRLGYLPQEFGFPRGFTAFGFVDYMALLKEWDERTTRHGEVRRVLDLVGLSEMSTKRVRLMSGGMRQRLGLAQALLGLPELLVLDEPSAGLDPEQRSVLRKILSGAAVASTVILATHQTEDVAALCDQVVVLDHGRVGFTGTVPELVARAAGRVWMADEVDPDAVASWRTGSGRHRHVGAPPEDAELVEPTVEDAYLLMRHDRQEATP